MSIPISESDQHLEFPADALRIGQQAKEVTVVFCFASYPDPRQSAAWIADGEKPPERRTTRVTGFIIGATESTCYIVTNRHCVECKDLDLSFVFYKNQYSRFELVGMSGGLDLAIVSCPLKVTAVAKISRRQVMEPFEQLVSFGHCGKHGRIAYGHYLGREHNFEIAQALFRADGTEYMLHTTQRDTEMTSLHGMGGSSGSAVFDMNFQVTGVLYASSEFHDRSMLVPAKDLLWFVKAMGISNTGYWERSRGDEEALSPIPEEYFQMHDNLTYLWENDTTVWRPDQVLWGEDTRVTVDHFPHPSCKISDYRITLHDPDTLIYMESQREVDERKLEARRRLVYEGGDSSDEEQSIQEESNWRDVETPRSNMGLYAPYRAGRPSVASTRLSADDDARHSTGASTRPSYNKVSQRQGGLVRGRFGKVKRNDHIRIKRIKRRVTL